MSLRFLLATIAALAVTSHSVSSRAETPRIVAGLHSADQLIGDLKYMVVELAEKEKAWDNNIYPNIDIFLIGVDTTQAVRWDVLFKTDEGLLYQPIIPIADLDGFLDDNLDPIGIIPKRDRRQKDLYELTGNVFEGWLRVLSDPDYVVIAKEKGDLPRDMPHPAPTHKELVKAGYLVFAEFKNDAAGLQERKASFDKFKANIVDGIKKMPDESKEAFALRQATSTQTMDLLGLYFSEAEKLRYGFKLDRATGVGLSEMIFSALPDTDLAESVDRIGKEPSHFAALSAAEDAVLDLRILFPVDETRQKSYAELYELARPVIAEKIDEDADASAEEKEARKQVSSLIQDILIESSSIGLIDLFAEISKSGEHHQALVATRCKATDKIVEVVKLLPAAQSGWSVEVDVAKVGDVAIHKLLLGDNIPQSLKDFYGDSGEIFLAAGPDSFWLAGGGNGLEGLKAAISKVDAAEPGEPSKTLVDLTMQTGPLLKSIDDFNKDEKLGVLKLFQARSFLKRKQQDQESEDEEQKKEVKPGARTAGALANFDWRGTAIEAMQGENDTVTFKLEKNDEGIVEGNSSGHKGVLKAFGAVLAKFADENLN